MFTSLSISRKPFLWIILLLCFANVAFADEQPPQWLRQASTQAIPAYEKDVPGVVLYDEQQVSLGSDGKLVTVENHAVKLLTREGRYLAVAGVFYLVNSGKVRDMTAWLVRADGSVKVYDKKTIIDRISDPDDVYDEGRVKMIDGSNDIDVGQTFGYTVTSEESPLFYQDTWSFQKRLPTLISRYSLNLPQGWKASSQTFNSADVTPQVNGSSYTWEMRNLAPIRPEPMSPSVANLSPRIVVNYSPDVASQGVNRAFADWLDVSRWATAMHDPQMIVDDNIAIKARELTAGAATELDKIRAIGAYVQNLQYISIDIGVGHGNGYRPHASNLVLSRGYGDCKDKANLMRALLKTLKIEAYPIAIYSGDPTFVRAEWASPRQFNHCIIAVKVGDGTTAATVMTHPKLGRLLIFDATDPFTPVGDLPDYLQGSNALIIAGENGGLAKMPVMPPGSDMLDRKIDVSLSEAGAIEGKISERAIGQTSSTFRRELRELSATDYKKGLEGWLTRGATGAQLVSFKPRDKQSENGFDLDMEFSVPSYGQLMQNRLLIFKPVVVSRRNSTSLTDMKRTTPIELDSNSMSEIATFTLPTGFVIDEMPTAVNLNTQFGTYSNSYEQKDGKLIFTRKMTTSRMLVPAEKYANVRDFFAAIRDAEQSPVVLLRK
ncbi:MAG: DUF3857 domain-containing protein [Acidobacteriota bacterium]